METLFLILLILAGLLLLRPIVEGVLSNVLVILSCWSNAIDGLGEHIAALADRIADDQQENARKRQFLKWFDARIGDAEPTGRLNDAVLAAHRQTPILRRLVDEEVPNAIRGCLNTHKLMAHAAGVPYMEDIAFEPECFGSRQHVVDLVETTVGMIQAYPLLTDDPTLRRNGIVLRKRILPTCRNCPYLNYAVAEAPPLCPSAEMAGIRPEDRDEHDHRKRRRP